MKDRIVGLVLDGVIWFSVASLILAVSGLGAAIIDDIRTITGM